MAETTRPPSCVRRALAIALILVALVASVPPAVARSTTLLVDGTAPSVYFQRMVDGFAKRAPVPTGTVDLYVGSAPGPPCPGNVPGTLDVVAACAMPPDLTPNHRPAIRLLPILFRSGFRDELARTVAHELGHVELDLASTTGGIMTDADRDRFDRIWRRPSTVGWWDPLTPGDCPISGVGADPRYGQTCGEGSAAGEWAADAYALCASGGWRADYDHIDLGYLPDFGWREDEVSNMHRTRAPIIASCRLFRAAAAGSGQANLGAN